MKKLLFTFLLFSLSFLSALSINSIKNVYNVNEAINIRVEGLTILPKNWLALYKKGSSNEWKNVLQWKWTTNTVSGNFVFTDLDAGEYEARVFYNNSYNEEAVSTFSVSNSPKAEVKTRSNLLKVDEYVWVQVNNMLGDSKDWVAIYSKGSSNDWGNVIQWKFLKGKKNTEVEFDPLPAGEYEARVFFKNSYKLEAQSSFTVNQYKISLPITSKHTTEEIISISHFKGFQKNRKDWVGIYLKGTDNSWKNVVAWKWIDDAISEYYLGFGKLPAGEYEARGFFKNSYKTAIAVPFSVVDFNIDKKKLIKEAKVQCLGQDNSTANIFCANDLDHVYMLTKRDLNDYSYWGQYEISLNDNSVKTIFETIVAPHEQWRGLRGRYFQEKIEGTSLYFIRSYIQGADENGAYSFYSAQSKLLLGFAWYEQNGVIFPESIKTLDNATKLYLERGFRDVGEKYKETYDISNPNEMKLINRDIVPMPFR